MFFVASNERIRYKSVISKSFTKDFQQEVLNQWVALEFSFYKVIILGVHEKNIPENDRYSNSTTDFS